MQFEPLGPKLSSMGRRSAPSERYKRLRAKLRNDILLAWNVTPEQFNRIMVGAARMMWGSLYPSADSESRHAARKKLAEWATRGGH